MKILQVIPYFTPKRGGNVNVVYNLSNQLVKRGHVVIIITTDVGFDKEYAESLKRVQVIPFKCIANIGLFISPSMKKWLKKNIRNYDIIHLHSFPLYQNVIVRHYAKKYNIPYVLQAHGSVLPVFQKQRLKKIFNLFFGYRILRDASKVIALTKTEVEQYKKMGVDEDKIEIVPNGIDLSEYNNLPKRGEFRKKYSIKDDEKIILYMGRLHKSKGIDLLVKAFSDVSKELDNVRLVFVGPDDGCRSALESIAQELKVNDKVLFTGFVSNDEKMAAFVDADVFVTPSFTGFPVTFLEACACSTPIITTEKGDILDWIHDRVGYVVEYDKKELRDALFKVLSDEGLRKRFGEEGRRLIGEEFGWEKIVEKVEGIYNCESHIAQKGI
jgi:glycosyltransferase involved in cell wall biosynthesis